MKLAIFMIVTFAIICVFSTQSISMTAYGNHFGSTRVYPNVYAGGGNTTTPLDEFDPVKKQIFTGESIKWSNPTAGKPYPHMVVFFGNASDSQLKHTILNLSKSLPAPNSELVMSNLNNLMEEASNQKENVTKIIDTRSILFPSVINSSSESNVYYLDPQGNRLYKGATYNMTGQELYLNSGLIWAGGTVPGNFSKIYSFIVKFENTGTYNYQCLLHPGMEGTVVVKPNPGRLGIQLN